VVPLRQPARGLLTTHASWLAEAATTIHPG
jgi:hypothetical protein